MTEVTKKSFDRLHKKMLLIDSYRRGYEYGKQNRKDLKCLGISLKTVRRIYLMQHTNFAAGLARVCFEIMHDSTYQGEAA